MRQIGTQKDRVGERDRENKRQDRDIQTGRQK